MKRNETDSKKNQLHLFRFLSFLRDGDSVSLCSVSLQKKRIPFRTVSEKIAVFRFVLFLLDIVSFRFHSVSENMESVPVHFVPFQTVPFRISSVPFLLNVRGFPFRTVSLLSNLFRFVVFPDNIYRFMFPSVPLHTFCLSCCSDATCHIQHS